MRQKRHVLPIIVNLPARVALRQPVIDQPCPHRAGFGNGRFQQRGFEGQDRLAIRAGPFGEQHGQNTTVQRCGDLFDRAGRRLRLWSLNLLLRAARTQRFAGDGEWLLGLSEHCAMLPERGPSCQRARLLACLPAFLLLQRASLRSFHGKKAPPIDRQLAGRRLPAANRDASGKIQVRQTTKAAAGCRTSAGSRPASW